MAEASSYLGVLSAFIDEHERCLIRLPNQCEGAWMPRRRPPGKPPRKSLPEEMAKDAIAHEEAVGSGKVRMTFRVILGRQQAEAPAARAIREERNIGALVTKIREAAVKRKA